MTAACPQGHSSTADDYCDVCGAPIDAGAVTPTPTATASAAASPWGPPSGGPVSCPHCATPNPAEALFCEACGYDFTTGTLPRAEAGPAAAPETPVPDAAATITPAPDAAATMSPPPPERPTPPGPAAELDWVAEVWVDPDWYAEQESTDPMPSPGLPVVVPLRARSVLVGRTSHSRNIAPDIACETDTGISRRQAQLTTDGSRWFVEDLDSANGTFVAPASGPVPPEPIPVGAKRELAADDRIYLGAWTRIVVRAATDDERSTL